ncbi:hypothetical protein B0H16DRAFT_1474371 [Mycena metata]|uniref:Uncharacterized protein n=1 Tax=Mycena metata TaxID=1033252 RepID=A0AAD7HHB1_9AGAR|nr:hypothetical protein B0H16DRAFT_1474371 [Mycena metata]
MATSHPNLPGHPPIFALSLSLRVMPADRTKSTPTPQNKKKTTREPTFRFQGERVVFLHQRLELFYDAVARNDLPNFWRNVFAQYWQLFPWRLPIDQDPHCAMLTDSSTSMTYDDIDKKTAIILSTQMERYLYYRLWTMLARCLEVLRS